MCKEYDYWDNAYISITTEEEEEPHDGEEEYHEQREDMAAPNLDSKTRNM